MRILRATATFYPHVTGPAYQAYRISKGMMKRGHESPIVTSDALPPEEEPGYPPDMEPEAEFPFDIQRRRVLFSVDQYRFPPGVAVDSVRRQYDIVHAHSYRSAVKDILFLTAKLGKKKPFIIHAHGSIGNNDPTVERTIQYKLYDRILGYTLLYADAVVVSSQQEHHEAREFGVPDEKIHVVPVGKDPDIYTQVPRSPPDDRFRMLFVGRLAPRRNVELLLRALTQLRNRPVEVRIVGGEGVVSKASRSGYFDELRGLCEELEINDKVTFTGVKYGDELVKEYRRAHAFVNPTHYENFGQATLEAAFAGLPIVATPTGVAPELVTEGETGFLVTSEDDLVASICRLIDEPELVESMSEQVQRVARRDYRWQAINDKYEQIYEEIATGRS
jgi:glycosyltransferase involved in cell wall biosynthesis